MSVITIFVLIPIILLVVFGIPLGIGLYVYRDAKRRGMNAALWTLIAILAPSFIGFIIYLLVRNNYSNLKCPRCEAPVTEDYVICPSCGAKLQPFCPNCATPVQTDWKVCPKCTQPLPEFYDDVVVPHQPKDKSLGKILAAIIVIPIVLIVVLILSVAVFQTAVSGGSSSAMGEVTLDELYREQETSEVQEWIESLEKDENKAYALEYVYTTPQDEEQYFYVLYIPGAGYGTESGFGVEHGGLFHDVFRVEFHSGERKEESVYCITATADTDKKMKLGVYLDDRELECEVTSVDFNPTMFSIETLAGEVEEDVFVRSEEIEREND